MFPVFLAAAVLRFDMEVVFVDHGSSFLVAVWGLRPFGSRCAFLPFF